MFSVSGKQIINGGGEERRTQLFFCSAPLKWRCYACRSCLLQRIRSEKELKPGPDHKLWRVYSTIAVISGYRKVWLLWSSSAVRGWMVDNELKKSDSSKAALQSVQYLIKEVWLRFSACSPHSYVINYFRAGWLLATTCSVLTNNVNITGYIALSDVLVRLTPFTCLWLSLRLWDHFVSSCGVVAFTVWPRVTRTVDDSGVHVCFLPLPKPSTWLPVLCWGSVSVHTAVMARIAAKQPENRYYRQ